MGRPTKLNSRRQTAICKALRHGSSFLAAAASAGIAEDTFTTWRKRGAEENSGPYHNLVLAIEKSLAEGEALAAQAVFKSFTETSTEIVEETLPNGDSRTKTITRPPDPRIALSWLERRVGGRWNPAHRVALGQDPDAAPVVTYLLPDNGRDATPESAGGAPALPTDESP